MSESQGGNAVSHGSHAGRWRFLSAASVVPVVVALASSARGESYLLHDYAFGVAGGYESVDESNATTTRLSAATFAHAEALAFGLSEGHMLLFDGHFLSFVGGGGYVEGSGSAFFRYRLLGNLNAGAQIFHAIPLNLSLEDLDISLENELAHARALIGTTMYVHLSVLGRPKFGGMFLALTPGLRLNSSAGDAAFGVQPKYRLLQDVVSIELSGTFAFASNLIEAQGKLIVAWNAPFGWDWGQVGSFARVNYLEAPGNTIHPWVHEAYLFVGVSLLPLL